MPHGVGLPVPETLDNFVIYSDDEDSVTSNSEEQQPSASRDAEYLPSTDSSNHKASSMTSSGISNFQKIRLNFWHQGYKSGIYFEKVSNGFLGYFKAASFRELVQDMMDSYEQQGCTMLLEITLSIFTPGFLSIKLW